MDIRNKKIIGMRAVNIVEFENPMTFEEWSKFHTDLVPKIDEVIYDLGYTKGRGITIPMYDESEED